MSRVQQRPMFNPISHMLLTCSDSVLRPEMTSRAPREAMCIAVTLPMPELAPTTDTDISVQSKETPCRRQRSGRQLPDYWSCTTLN